MRRFNIALAALLATAGFGATAQAREVPSSPAPSAQAPGAQQQPTGKRLGRHLRRAGTSTAGSDSFLPALGSMAATLGATGAIAAAGSAANSTASPE